MGSKEALKQHEEWHKLFKENPEEFERAKKDLIENAIKIAPSNIQLKLRAIQAKFDGRMRRLGTTENRLAYTYAELMSQFQEFNRVLQEQSKKLKSIASTYIKLGRVD